MSTLSHCYPVGCNRWLRKSWNSSTGLELGNWRKFSLGLVWIRRFSPFQNLRNIHDLHWFALYIHWHIYIYIHFQKCFSGRLGRKSWVFKTGWLWRWICDICSLKSVFPCFISSLANENLMFSARLSRKQGKFLPHSDQPGQRQRFDRDWMGGMLKMDGLDWDRMQKV